MALSRAASATARAYQPVERHWLRHTLKFMAAAFFNDEQASDLVLRPRRYDDRPWLR
jgi:hypothetical protein